MHVIDLRSDTVTQPTQAMRDAMASAEVGDDVYEDDPTVNRLQAVAAEWTGKEAALYVPSGTMANQIAVRACTQPGDALIAARDAHVYLYEAGGSAALSGVQTALIGEDGLFSLEDVQAAAVPDDIHFAPPQLVCIENTHNRSGGRIFPQDEIVAIGQWAQQQGWRMHLDGARIFNASVALGVPVSTLTHPFDSVSFCLSKGLGAPVGSLVCGSRDFITRARRIRKLFGGGMRQVGILAAAGLHALDHHVERLADDHARAARFAAGLAELGGVEIQRTPQTNIVVFTADDVPGLYAAAEKRGLLLSLLDATTLRIVTHLGVDDEDMERAIKIMQELLS